MSPTPHAELAVGGLPYFGRRLAGLLDGDGWRARYLETRGWAPRAALAALRTAVHAGLIYLVGGQIERLSRPHLLRLAVRAPIVMHWAGSDVLHARRTRSAGRATPALVRGVTHWTGAPWLVDELAIVGVRARWLPHSWVDAPASVPPLPSSAESPFTVLTYLPSARLDFYGGEAVRHLAARLPDVDVLVAGTDTLPWGAANVRCLGWVADMAPVYARSHALLRLPQHDGLSFMVQEALAFGRHAIWRYPFTGAIQADDAGAAIAAVRALSDRHAAGTLPLNEVGAAHVRERFSRERIRAGLRAGFAEVLR